ncbi:MAG: hypothetical protein GC149_15665 [Gammaproteobacteria bacterium]|nr:hypothetical protein [Gammaproteobacteria bacterium]
MSTLLTDTLKVFDKVTGEPDQLLVLFQDLLRGRQVLFDERGLFLPGLYKGHAGLVVFRTVQ